jgi:hypothetical protein
MWRGPVWILIAAALLVMTNPLATDHGAAPRRGVVVLAALTNGPLRAIRIDVMTAVGPADDFCLHVDRSERQGAER